MSTFCAVDSFIIGSSDAVGTTFTRVFTDAGSGQTFQPKFIFLFCSGRVFGTSGISRDTMQQSRGVAISPTIRHYIAAVSNNNVGTTYCRMDADTDACLAIMKVNDPVETAGRLDYDAVLVDGARFIIDESFGRNLSIGLIALGGDITDADFVTQFPNDDGCGTDPVDVTGFGFDPAFGLGLMYGRDDLTPEPDEYRMGMGAFRTTTEEGAWGIGGEGDEGTADTAGYSRYVDSSLARVSGGGAVRFCYEFNALITDGFRFNCIFDNDVTNLITGLLGGSYSVLEFDTRTTLGTITLTPGFEVSGGIIMSACRPESADNLDEVEPKASVTSIGAFSGVLSVQQFAYYAFDADGVGTTEVTNGKRIGSVYMNGDEAAAPAVAGSIEVQTINATEVILDQSIADADANHCIAILFGTRGAPAPAGGLVPSLGLLGVGQ